MSDLRSFNKMIVAPNTQAYLAGVLGERKGEFINNITALVSSSRQLQECEPTTLMFAALKATSLNLPLDPNLAQAHVIPFRNNKLGKTEAQFQIGWRGFVQLAIRSGQFQTINVTDIRQGEIQGYDLISGEMMVKAMPEREKLPVEGYMAFFRLTNGFSKSLYMTAGEVEQHAKRYSQTYSSKNDYVRNSSKWTTDFDAMAKKTVLKLLLNRFAPLSVEMRDAVQSDQAVLRGDKNFDYVDNDSKSTLDLARQAMQAEEAEVTEIVDTEKGELSAEEPKVKLSDQLKEKLNIDTDEVISGKAAAESVDTKKTTKQKELFDDEK